MSNPTSPALDAARRHRHDEGWRVLSDFASLLRIPNVTGMVDDLRRNAAQLQRRFEDRGGSLEIVEIDGASPVVVGELRTDNPTATIGVYVHYDGQPVSRESWTEEPSRHPSMTGPSTKAASPSTTRVRETTSIRNGGSTPEVLPTTRLRSPP